MQRIFAVLKYSIGWPLSLLAVFFIFKLIGTKLGDLLQVKEINPLPLIFSIICFLLYFFLRSLLWQKLLRAKGYKLSYKETTYLWGIAELKRYVPGNVWSFLGKTVSFGKKGIEKKIVISCMIIEGELIILGSLFFSLFCVFLLLQKLPSFPHMHELFLLINACVLGVTLLFIFNQNVFKRMGKLKLFSYVLSGLPPKENSKLFLYSLPPLFFFGLGMYFATASIVYLNIYWIKEYISLFIFALLAGYVSIITPVGLGVREAVIIYYFSRIMPLSIAALIAIFTRVIFIIAELIFLGCIVFWKRAKNNVFLRAFEWINHYKIEIIVSIAILLYIVYFTAVSFFRYDNFFTGRFDLGNMDQAVWNSLHGRIFQITDPNGTDIISRLSFHADFLLVLLSPFYLIWSHPKMLLLIQTIFLGSGGIFVYLLVKDVLKQKSLALVFAVAYLLNPSLQYANLYDFHPVSLATTFLLAAFYFLQKRKYFWLVFFLILAGISKEEIWVVTALIGGYVFLKDKRVLGAIISAVSLSIFYVIVWKLIPGARGSQHFALSYYSDFGATPGSVMKHILLTPQKTIVTIFQKDQLTYLVQIFAPLGFFSFLAPSYLIFAAPDLVLNLLSNNTQLHQIFYQYTSAITPFIIVSAIFGVKRLQKHAPSISCNAIAFFLFATSLLTAYAYGPLPGSLSPNIAMFNNQLDDKQIINAFLAVVPNRYSIAATNNIGSHLSRRQKIYTVPVGIDKADLILFLLNDPFAQPSLAAQKTIVKNLKHDKNYIEVISFDDFIVFEKRNVHLQNAMRPKELQMFHFQIPQKKK